MRLCNIYFKSRRRLYAHGGRCYNANDYRMVNPPPINLVVKSVPGLSRLAVAASSSHIFVIGSYCGLSQRKRVPELVQEGCDFL